MGVVRTQNFTAKVIAEDKHALLPKLDVDINTERRATGQAIDRCCREPGLLLQVNPLRHRHLAAQPAMRVAVVFIDHEANQNPDQVIVVETGIGTWVVIAAFTGLGCV